MYSSFRVQNFRGFRDLRLDDLARVNLIAGKNNTGKSALLEAIYTYTGVYDASRLLRAPAPPARQSQALNPTDLMNVYEGETERSLWDTLFHSLESDKPILMCGETTCCQKLSPPIQEEATDLEISVVDIDQLPDDSRLFRLAIHSGLDLSLPAKFLRFRSEERNSVHLAWSRRFFADKREPLRFPAKFIPSSEMVPRSQDTLRFSRLLVESKSGNLLPLLLKFEPRITELALIGEPASIYGYLKGLKQPLPISTMGEGIRRITSLMLAIGTTEGGVVFIDEIENGIHHSVQVDVWKAIAEAARQFNVQIFATTHSYEMIQAAHEAFKEKKPFDFRLFGLRRKRESNELRAVSYDEETLDAAIDMYLEMR